MRIIILFSCINHISFILLYGIRAHGQEFSFRTLPHHSIFSPVCKLGICEAIFTNYLLWRSQILPLIKSLGLENHLTDVGAPPEEIENENGMREVNPSYAIQVNNDGLLMSWLMGLITKDISQPKFRTIQILAHNPRLKI